MPYKDPQKRKENNREYHQRPEVKAKQLERSRTKEVKEKRRIRQSTPEFKEKNRAYMKTPAQQKRIKKYKQTEKYKKKQAEYMSEYRQRTKHKQRTKELWSVKYRTNPSFKLRCNMSMAINQSLKNKGVFKRNRPWQLLVDFTLEELKTHLESKFQEGMTWQNHGKWNGKPNHFVWHIDHIRPISSFNIYSLNCEDFKKCWCLENLQPLWAIDNIKKSDKYEGVIET